MDSPMDTQPSGPTQCWRCRSSVDGSTMQRLGWHPANPLWSCKTCYDAQRATGKILK